MSRPHAATYAKLPNDDDGRVTLPLQHCDRAALAGHHRLTLLPALLPRCRLAASPQTFTMRSWSLILLLHSTAAFFHHSHNHRAITSQHRSTRRASAPMMGVAVETTSPGDGTTYPKKGDFVTAHYTGKLDDGFGLGLLGMGLTFDSSRSGEPLEFQIGVGQVSQPSPPRRHGAQRERQRAARRRRAWKSLSEEARRARRGRIGEVVSSLFLRARSARATARGDTPQPRSPPRAGACVPPCLGSLACRRLAGHQGLGRGHRADEPR